MDFNDLRQGVVLTTGIRDVVDLSLDKKPSYKENAILVLVTQDCDIVADSEKEPYLEFILGERITCDLESVGSFFNGKNPRKLAVEESDAEYFFEIHDKFRVEKENFKSLTYQCSKTKLNVTNRRILIKWIAKHYLRAAFPDEFNARLSKIKAYNSFPKNSLAKQVITVFFKVEDEELSADENYKVDIAIIVADDCNDDVRKEIKKKFEDIFSEKNNFCSDVQVLDEDDFTLRDLHTYQRWDKDSYSLNGEANPIDDIDID